MGLRAYLLVDVVDEMEQQEFIEVLRELEEMPEVDFVEPVIGLHDMVVMVDAPVTVETIANKVSSKNGVKAVEIIKVISLFERHRASKRELLEALGHGGI